MSSLILAENVLLEAASVVASSSPAGFEIENAFDGLLGDWWQPGDADHSFVATFPTAATISAIGIGGHNLGTKTCHVTVEVDSGSGYVQAAFFAVLSDADFVYQFPPVSGTSVRVIISSGIGYRISHIALGTPEEISGYLTPAFTPPHLAVNREISTSLSVKGLPLSRSATTKMIEVDANYSQVSPSWSDVNWVSIYGFSLEQPVFFAWDIDQHPDQIVLCWTDDSIRPSYSDTLYQQIRFRAMAYKAEMSELVKLVGIADLDEVTESSSIAVAFTGGSYQLIVVFSGDDLSDASALTVSLSSGSYDDVTASSGDALTDSSTVDVAFSSGSYDNVTASSGDALTDSSTVSVAFTGGSYDLVS